VLHSLAPLNVLNAGTVRPCNAILPEGTVVNPQHPAAVGMRSLTSAVLQACTFGVFSQVLPHLLPACPSGGSSNLNVKTLAADGRQVLSSIGPCGGGAGGGPERDGVEGCGANSAFLKNTPVEINEAEVPIEIIRYGLVPDTGGAGEQRGGNAATLEFRVLSPNAVVTARNRNRTDLAAWGVLGGKAGANSRFVKNPETPNAVELRNMDVVPCAPGDVIRVQGPGGGGYGDPFKRSPDKVLHDVRCGFVSLDNARVKYGVAITPDLKIDEKATQELRSRRAAPTGAHYDFGPGRSRFESIWTRKRYEAFTAIARAIPVSWAHYVKHHLFTSLKDNVAPVDGGAADVFRSYDELRAQFPKLPKVTA
jgi:N-methylhydantoinase B